MDNQLTHEQLIAIEVERFHESYIPSIGELDQLEAHSRDIAAISGGNPITGTKAVETMARIVIAIDGAIPSEPCPHLADITAPQIVSLTHKRRYCPTCFGAHLAELDSTGPAPIPPGTEDLCDYCHRVTDEWKPLQLQANTMTLMGSACPSCHEAITEQQGPTNG